MSINTLGYNTSIALGALFGGLLVDGFGLASAVWFGVVLTSASLVVTATTRRTAAPAAADSGEVLAASR